MEHRDKTKADAQAKRPKGNAGSNQQSPVDAAPIDLFAIDLSAEIPPANDAFAGLPEFGGEGMPVDGADPFANVPDPFAALPDPFASPAEPQQSAAAEPTVPQAAKPVAAKAIVAKPVNTVAAPVAKAGAQPTGQSTTVQATVAKAGPQSAAQPVVLTTGAFAAGQAAAFAPVMIAQEAAPEEAPIPDIESARRRKFFWTAAPSWAISLTVHVAILFILAALSLEEVQKAISVLQAGSGEAAEAIENFDLQGPTAPMDLPSDDEITPPTVTPAVSMPEITQPEMTPISTAFSDMALTSMTENVLPSAMLSSAVSSMKASLNSRSAAAKSEMLEKFGGNASSEKSVAMALKWIAEHQAPNGGWSFAHSAFCRGQCKEDGTKFKAVNGATAMALLPFLGAGQTHVQGQYKDTIKKGLGFLITNMQVKPGELPTGSWNEADGNMYSHGLAAITICEAYAMTRDPDLLQPAQLAINYLVYAQDPRGGGWRYGPQQAGDTSVVGWCLMALKSGTMGNLTVPPTTFRGASNFLDFVSTNNGAYYGYDKPTSNIEGRQATIAVGLLCRMYLGWPKDHEAIKAGVEYLDKRGPSASDLYYSYYATQVMRHHGGPEWEKWNTKLRDDLIKAQVAEGHAAGSWYSAAGHGKEGGRLYATSLSTMILEVYYRHMPLYSDKSSDDKFEL